ncbi:hypothetical protein, partial [Brevibacillus borstelensis]|uniref:hypothetical protein n=1 Tax=Brevibacillus borstelensis TaxID=45462 RepID=UPI001C0FD73D
RASTLGFLHQLPVSYEVTWLLPRLDFHQLAINGLLGTLHTKKPRSSGRGCVLKRLASPFHRSIAYLLNFFTASLHQLQ